MCSLSLNLITRGRPELLRRTIELTLPNISLKTTELMVSCDDDDYASTEVALDYPEVTVSMRKREDSVGEKVNRVLTVAPNDLYATMVDWAPIITPGFDQIIHEAAAAFLDGYFVINGPLANLSFPCLQVVSHKFVDASAGTIYPEFWPYWFMDHWLDDIGRMIGRMGFAAVNVDQSMRPAKTHELRDVGMWANLYDALAWCRHIQASAIMSRSDFQTPQWMKEALIQYWPQIDLRGRAINHIAASSGVEAMRGGEVPNERYLRIKAKGEGLLAQLREQK